MRAVPSLNFLFPYQVLGFGLTLEVLPVPWLRLSAFYSYGVYPVDGTIDWDSYGEGLLGVRLFGLTGESAVDIPLRPPSPAWQRPPPVVKA